MPARKLTNKQVLEIRRLYKEGVSKNDIRIKMGIQWSEVDQIVKNNIYKWVENENSKLPLKNFSLKLCQRCKIEYKPMKKYEKKTLLLPKAIFEKKR